MRHSLQVLLMSTALLGGCQSPEEEAAELMAQVDHFSEEQEQSQQRYESWLALIQNIRPGERDLINALHRNGQEDPFAQIGELNFEQGELIYRVNYSLPGRLYPDFEGRISIRVHLKRNQSWPSSIPGVIHSSVDLFDMIIGEDQGPDGVIERAEGNLSMTTDQFDYFSGIIAAYIQSQAQEH